MQQRICSEHDRPRVQTQKAHKYVMTFSSEQPHPTHISLTLTSSNGLNVTFTGRPLSCDATKWTLFSHRFCLCLDSPSLSHYRSEGTWCNHEIYFGSAAIAQSMLYPSRSSIRVAFFYVPTSVECTNILSFISSIASAKLAPNDKSFILAVK